LDAAGALALADGAGLAEAALATGLSGVLADAETGAADGPAADDPHAASAADALASTRVPRNRLRLITPVIRAQV